jgi:subfamily B ATP-binding cassette protein MsbA
MNTYRRLIQFARPFYTFLPAYVIFIIIWAILEKFNIVLFAPILEVLFDENGSTLEATSFADFPTFHFSSSFLEKVKDWGLRFLMGGESKKNVLLTICLTILATVFLANLFSFLAGFTLASLKGRIVTKIRTQVYEKLTNLHLGYFSNERRGDIISRLTNDVREVESILVASVQILLKEPITIIITFTFLFYISAKLVLFSLIVMPITAVIIALITKKLRGKSKQSQSYLGEILDVINETIGGLRVIQAFNAQKKFQDKFGMMNHAYKRLLKSIDVNQSLAGPFSQFFGVSIVVMILYYGGTLVFENQLERSLFIPFIFLFATVISPIKSFANAISSIQRGLVAGERIFEVLDADQEIISKHDAIQIKGFNDKLELKNVSFSYGDKMVLSDISLTIPKGKSIALVGPSGGGKSTLMDHFPRFLDAQKGTVTIDGINLKDADLHSLRCLMGTVTQDSILFNDNIFNNIAFGIEATKEQVEQAAKVANAHNFIMESENGYQTEIGDSGMKLSGGQRQRLTIARAVLKNPDILLLDEATSALDSQSERLVQGALNKLMDNRTSIVIAHRLSTIQHVDEIVVIEEGKIKERGTHAELIANEDVYFKLYNMQSFD